MALTGIPTALAEGVAYIPGPAFSPRRHFGDSLRLCFASTDPARIDEGVRRLRRAVDNHFEGLILFTLAVVVVTRGGQGGGTTAACAWIYLAARILYVPAYAFGWTPWRSVIFAAGFAATLTMIVTSLL